MTTRMKRLVSLFLIVLLVIGSVNLTAYAAKSGKAAVKKVTVTGSKYVAKGKKIKLTASVAPENANQKVTWSSDNPKVATVDKKGNVKGIKPGKAKITAASVDNPKKKKAYTVQVMEQPVKKVKISGAVETMNIGESITLKATQDPKKAAKSFEWKSSDSGVATVNAKGVVTAVSAGSVSITATATDGSKKKASVTIQVIDPAPITPEPAPITPEPAPITPEPAPVTPDPATLDQDFDKDGASYHYDGSTGTVTLTSISGDATGHATIPAEVEVPNVGTKKVSAVAKAALSGSKLNYVEVKGEETKVEDATGVAYVIAPNESQITDLGGAEFVAESSVKKEGDFLYAVGENSATLLCPVDSGKALTTMEGSDVVEIPGTVAGKKVTEVSKNAVNGATNGNSVKLSVPEYTNVDDSITNPVEVRMMAAKVTITNEENVTELEAGKTLQLAAEATTDDSVVTKPTNDKINWSTNDETIATVSETGLVTAVAYGEATITATAADGSGAKAELKLQIWNVPATITISDTIKDTMNVGDPSVALAGEILPDGLKPDKYEISWSVAPEGIATITEGKLDAVAGGEFTLTASLEGTEVKASQKIKVYALPTGVMLTQPTTQLFAESSLVLEWTFDGENYNPDYMPIFISSDETVATVKDGVVTGVMAGTVTITAKIKEDDEGSSVTLEVQPKAVDPETVTVKADKTTLNAYEPAKDNTATLTATVLPAEASQTVIWSSSDDSIAKVSKDGTVTALKAGTVTITATATETVKGTVEITVIDERLVVDADGKLTDIDIKAYLTEDGKLVIPEKTADGREIKALADGLLKEKTEIKELTIPTGVTAVPESLCEGCTGLTKVIMPNGITVIGKAAFKGCTSLSSSECK